MKRKREKKLDDKAQMKMSPIDETNHAGLLRSIDESWKLIEANQVLYELMSESNDERTRLRNVIT